MFGHERCSQIFFNLPGPPNFFMSKQAMHLAQLSLVHQGHVPHALRFPLEGGRGARFFQDG